jgi:hypothetical protein
VPAESTRHGWGRTAADCRLARRQLPLTTRDPIWAGNARVRVLLGLIEWWPIWPGPKTNKPGFHTFYMHACMVQAIALRAVKTQNPLCVMFQRTFLSLAETLKAIN